MQRTTAAYTVAASLILTLGVAPAHNVTPQMRPAHAAGRPEGVTACGVEQWAVKTGIDPDARLVNQKVVVPTTIVHSSSPRSAVTSFSPHAPGSPSAWWSGCSRRDRMPAGCASMAPTGSAVAHVPSGRAPWSTPSPRTPCGARGGEAFSCQ